MNWYPLSRTRPRTRVFTLCLWAMTIANLGFVIHFGLFSRPPLSPHVLELWRFDLILHCMAFAGLSIPALMLFRSMVRTGLGIFLLGFGLELAQWVSASRQASLSDLGANAAGIVLAAFIIVMLRKADFAFLRPVLARAV